MVGSPGVEIGAKAAFGPQLTELAALPSAFVEAAWSAARSAHARHDARFVESPWAPEFAASADDVPHGAAARRILKSGAHRADERKLAAALIVLGAAAGFPGAPKTERADAHCLVWLETHTGLSLLGPLLEHLGERGAALVHALEALLHDEESPLLPSEAWVASTALTHVPGALQGELGAPPRGPVMTALLTVTLWTCAVELTRHLGRRILGYRAQAQARVTGHGLELSIRKELLGRTLRDVSLVVPFNELSRLSRETRFARAGLYAGLVSLTLGTDFGAGFFVDALRAKGAAPSLFGIALLLVAAGIALDFAFQALSARDVRACRLVIVPKRGPGFALTGVESARADAMLRQALAASSQARSQRPET